MIPAKSHPKWSALVEGRFEHKFSKAAASMLVFQLKAQVRQDPSPASRAKAIDALHAFCEKYERMMAEDLTAIFN